MASRNRVDLIGRIGNDPEVRYTAAGEAVVSFRLATTETWKDKATGERKESTDWHRIVLFGKVAEIASQYGSKGREVLIEGKLKTRKWQDKEGKDQYTTEVQVHEYAGFMLLGPKPTSSAPSTGGEAPDKSHDKPRDNAGGKPKSFEFDEGQDIPF